MASDPLGLLDSAPCGFLSFDDGGRVALVNRTLADRLGRAREEIVGRHVEELFPIATRLFCQTHLFPLIRMRGDAREIFLLLRTKAGDDVGMLCNARRAPRDGVEHTDCILIEVDERRKYEDALLAAKRFAEDANKQLEEQAVELEMQHQQLQEQATEMEVQSDALQSVNDDLMERGAALERAQAEAETANKAKSQFLATMSHELRTPLNAIGGYTSLLATGIYGPVNAQQSEALDRVNRAQRHLMGLINDILNLARVEAGRVDYVITNVRVGEVTSELAAMMEPQVRAKQQMYEVTMPGEDVVLRADHEKVVQVLLNLLSNAVKFTPAGGRITLSCSRGERDARIVVADTGRGIPADQLEAVFEPFVQVRAEPNTPNEGTGLGLAISRNLARGMGGDLTATSVVGEGSTFTLTLPAAP